MSDNPKVDAWWRVALRDCQTFLTTLAFVLLILAWFVAAAKEHWVLVLLLAAAFGGVLAMGFKDILRLPERREAFGVIALMIAITMAIFASVSFAVHKLAPANYEGLTFGPDRDADSFGTFLAYYAWLFLDLIPVLEVNKTLQIEAPLRPIGVWAGLPVLAFRGFVILILLKAIKDWWQRTTKARLRG